MNPQQQSMFDESSSIYSETKGTPASFKNVSLIEVRNDKAEFVGLSLNHTKKSVFAKRGSKHRYESQDKSQEEEVKETTGDY
jgi:hypothetical protein